MSDDDDFDDIDDDDDFDASPIAKKKAPAAKASSSTAQVAAKKPAATKKKAVQKDKENDASDGEDGVEAGKTKKSKKDNDPTAVFQKLTQLEHVLKRPDMYIGSVQIQEQEMWVWNVSQGKKETVKAGSFPHLTIFPSFSSSLLGRMEYRTVSFPPGLYKIFDEILVNAADNAQRSSKMKNIKVNIDAAMGRVRVWNDGQGIPVAVHEKEKVYIPYMIFGELLTGTNFNDDQKKVVGGRNGYGAKLTNIFSRKFTIECLDSQRGLKYTNTWSNNMQDKGNQKIDKDTRKVI